MTLGNVSFIAFNYIGDIPTGAFGFNSNGIAFSLNWLGPSNMIIGGLTRNFISRDLLNAESFDDGFKRITRPK